MIQVDCSSSSFWEGLSTLGICDYEVRFPMSATRGTIDLSSGHITEEDFLVPEAGLSFRGARRGMVYASVKSAVLYFISENRELALILEPKLASSRRQLYFITGAFWMGNMLQEYEPASLKTPSLCPCCRDAADCRVSSMAQNPLTIMLARIINKRIAVTISMSNGGGNSVISHAPMNLLKKGSHLVSEGQSSSMEVDINYLYAFRLDHEDFDGENHQRLLLFNSHGNNFCGISASSSDVGDLWRTVLDCEKGGYELAGQDDHKK